MNALLRTAPFAASTRTARAKAMQQILRWLWQYHGAPRLDHLVARFPAPRPRNITVTDKERATLLELAPPHVHLWLLLCSDLAIRSGTALRLAGHNYDPHEGTLRFHTKCDERLTLPVTDEIATILRTCDPQSGQSFVAQLWHRHNRTTHQPGTLKTYTLTSLGRTFRQLCKSAGITRNIRPHDLRRTTAVKLLEETKDLRDVQALLGHKNLESTLWYLDHDLRPVSRRTLEILKRPSRNRRQKTA